MAVSNVVVLMVKVLAIIHIVVGALLIVFSIVYALAEDIGILPVLSVCMGVWVSFASLSKFRFRKVHANILLAFLVVFLTLAYQPTRSYQSMNHFEFPLLKSFGGDEVKMQWIWMWRSMSTKIHRLNFACVFGIRCRSFTICT